VAVVAVMELLLVLMVAAVVSLSVCMCGEVVVRGPRTRACCVCG
jgi:hypothetical protein